MTGRGRRGRRIARGLILLAVAYGIATLVFWIAQPAFMAMFEAWYAPLLPVVGIASYFLGLGWMIWIYRADPEPDARSWRYRDV
jgi:hypothetical protein